MKATGESKAKADGFSPGDIEVVWSRLLSIMDEAAATMIRTAYSITIRESKDLAVVVFDREGRALAESAIASPSFIGTLPRTLDAFLAEYPAADWREGDLVITNDPWIGSGHLQDITMAAPILAGRALVGFVAISAHGPDIGGTLYSALSREIFEEGLTESTLGRALAAYQRALLSGDSPFDRWHFGREELPTKKGSGAEGYPALAAQGFTVFQDKGCAACHRINDSSALFTDGQFHNTGTGYLRAGRSLRPPSIQLAPGIFVVPTVDAETETFTDHGRYEVTGREADKWRYRTPSLRNVALTGPYMHDGSIATLEAVVAFYAEGGGGDPAQDPLTRSVQLTQSDQEALVAFLMTLTSSHVDVLVSDARSVTIGERTAGGQ